MRFFKVCCALGCLVLWAHQSFAGDAQWVEVRSPNFSVITDAGEKRGRDVALHFEQMRAVFGTLMTKANVNLSVPLQIVAFRNSKEMREIAPVFNGKPTEVAGLFQGNEDRNFIMLDMSATDPWSVVFHEYAHQLMNGNLPVPTAPWFEEGFAEYFASTQVDNKEARVGKIPEYTYRILQGNGMMRARDLLRVQQYSKTYNDSGDHRNTFYAESALLVHYLYDNQLILKLGDYFDAVNNQKKPVDVALQQAFGVTTDQLDKILVNYLNGGRFRYNVIPTPRVIVASAFTEATVTLADARAVLADIDAHSHDHRDRALGEFQEVLKIDPDNTSALRGAGYAYLQRQDFEHAGEYFKRAAGKDSKDPRVHYYNALLMNGSGPIVAGTRFEEIKKELNIAIALDPKLADAYSLLGYAQAFSGEPEKGLATIKKALELSPRNETYQFNLANIYMANRKPDEAIALLRNLSGSANPEVVSHAQSALVEVEKFREQAKSAGARIEVRSLQNAKVRDDGDVPENNVEVRSEVKAPLPSVPGRFITGKLASVDCSSAPQAVLSVVSGGRSLKLRIVDSKHVVLIGADEFSCEWKNKSVAINYRARQDGGGDVVSLEVH